MKSETGRKARRMDAGAVSAVAIGAFAAGILAGGALVIGLYASGRMPAAGLNLGKPRPRRLLIGNLEIEERGDDTRFRVD